MVWTESFFDIYQFLGEKPRFSSYTLSICPELKRVSTAMSASKNLKVHHSCNYCQLMHVCLPKDLALAELIDLNSIIEQDYQLEVDSVLTRPGELFHYLYAVRSGSFKETSVGGNGEERIIDFYLPGDIIGLDAINQKKYNYLVVALEKSIVCRITFNNLLKLANKHSDLQYRLLSMMSEKLLDRTRINNHQQAEQRVAAFLLHLSKRSAQRGLSPTQFQLSMSRNDIGKYLNLTLETVSRMFAKFKAKGIITMQKKLVSLDKPCELAALMNV